MRPPVLPAFLLFPSEWAVRVPAVAPAAPRARRFSGLVQGTPLSAYVVSAAVWFPWPREGELLSLSWEDMCIRDSEMYFAT